MHTACIVKEKEITYETYERFRSHLEFKESEILLSELSQSDKIYDKNFSDEGRNTLSLCIENIFNCIDAEVYEAKLFNLLFSENDFCNLDDSYVAYIFELKVIAHYEDIKAKLISFDDIKDIIEDSFITNIDKLKNDEDYRECCIRNEVKTSWAFFYQRFNIEINRKLEGLTNKRYKDLSKEDLGYKLLNVPVVDQEIFLDYQEQASYRTELIDAILKYYISRNTDRDINIFRHRFISKTTLNEIAKANGEYGERTRERVRQIIDLVSDFISRFKESDFLKGIPRGEQLEYLKNNRYLNYINEFNIAKQELLNIIDSRNGFNSRYEYLFSKLEGGNNISDIWDNNFTHVGPSRKVLKLLNSYLKVLEENTNAKEILNYISNEDKEYIILHKFRESLKNYILALKKIKKTLK